MSTTLFHDIIVGPIRSRRLGSSLGVNLMPVNGKICNFDCIYCECGWNDKSFAGLRHNDRGEVRRLLEWRLKELAASGETPDVITFAGNGEPTLHPDFAGVIDDTVALRDRYCPGVKVAVLSNATMLGRETVRDALAKVDRAILKIDSGRDETIRQINKPCFRYALETVIENMSLFRGEIIVQTMLLRGEYEGRKVDNTTEEEVSAWLDAVRRVKPVLVMLYGIDRDTPAPHLQKVPVEEMERVAGRVRALGIDCMVTG